MSSKVTARPRNPDVLRDSLVDQFDVDQIAIHSDPLDAGPPKLRPARSETPDKVARAMKFAHVKTISYQFFDRQRLSFFSARHGAS
jgi:hypothetical protein